MAAFYVKVDESGYVVGVSYQDAPPEDGIYHEVSEQPHADIIWPYKTLFANGQYQRTEELWMVPSYQQERAASYPPIGDQLDMFWHAMDSGALPKIQPFYDQIKSVKEQYPKPSQ